MKHLLKVCLISPNYLEKINRGILQTLGKYCELVLISPKRFNFSFGIIEADFPDNRNYSLKLFNAIFPIGLKSCTRYILGTSDLGFKKFKPDIIHIENEVSGFIVLQALIYRKLYVPKAKVIVSYWENQWYRSYKGFLVKVLAWLMKRHVDFFIAANIDGKKILQSIAVPSNKITVHPTLGVDLNYFKPTSSKIRMQLRKELNISKNEFVIGFCGRFVEEKGINDLLKAFNMLKKQYVNKEIRLLCVGDGVLKPLLLNHEFNITVVTPGVDVGVSKYYHLMDVLVLPSKTKTFWKEQFGRVLIEGMASGVPVIGSNSGAIPEVISDSGLIFHEGKIDELFIHLEQLLNNISLRSEFYTKGIKRVSDEYTVQEIAKKNFSIYKINVIE